MNKLSEIFRAPFLLAIRAYQKTISPDHGFMRHMFPGGYCKFNPTCSQYMYLSIEKYGVFRGIPKGTWRILRCNPCSTGGDDNP